MRLLRGKTGYVVLTAVAALLLSSTTFFFAQTGEARAQPRAPVVSGACDPVHMKYKASHTAQSTSSTSFVNVIDSNFRVTLHGLGCVIIMFTAEARPDPGEQIRVAVDGLTCGPGENVFASSDASLQGFSSFAMNFVCSNVPAGTHQVRLRFRSASGDAVYLRARTVIVWYSS